MPVRWFSCSGVGAGPPVCIVREALLAPHRGCDRVPARLQGIIATVPDPEGLWEFLFILQIKTTQHHCIEEESEMWSDILSLDFLGFKALVCDSWRMNRCMSTSLLLFAK